VCQGPGWHAHDGEVGGYVPSHYCAGTNHSPFAHPDFGQESATSTQQNECAGCRPTGEGRVRANGVAPPDLDVVTDDSSGINSTEVIDVSSWQDLDSRAQKSAFERLRRSVLPAISRRWDE